MNSKAGRAGRKLAILLGMLAMTGSAIAQTVNDAEVPQTALDLPSNLQIFGKADPNVRKPTAIVNDAVITGTDVDHRVSAVVALNRFQLSNEERDRLRLQMLRTLIDETLQIQEAKAKDITVSSEEIEQSFNRVARNYGRTSPQFAEWLRSVGSSERSIKRQIEGELAWQRLLRRQVEWKINVSDEEVNAILKKMEEAKGTEEYSLREIYLSANPDRANEVFTAMQRMIAQMREGTPFEYLARTYSEATTRSTGGDLGWVRASVLPEPLARAATTMQVGQVAGPIEVPGGFSILFMADKRQVLTADPRDARLSLRQLTLSFPSGTSQAVASARAADFAKATSAMQGCGDVSKTASQLGADVIDNDAITVRQLPQQLQEIMLKMQVGEATPPFGSPEDGIRVLVLCGRDDPRDASLPSADQLRARIEEERVGMRAARMLRDLRRDALVEYR